MAVLLDPQPSSQSRRPHQLFQPWSAPSVSLLALLSPLASDDTRVCFLLPLMFLL